MEPKRFSSGSHWVLTDPQGEQLLSLFAMSQPRVYLDKIATSSHLPRGEGSQKLQLVTRLPDLSHTGINVAYQVPPARVCAPDGYVSNRYKFNSYLSASHVERPKKKMENKTYFHIGNHRDFLNKVLCDLQNDKDAKLNRTVKYFSSEKSKIGFEESFNDLFDSTLTGSESMTSNLGRITEYNDPKKIELQKNKREMKVFRKKGACGRNGLFECLLDTLDLPASPVKRFGSLNRADLNGAPLDSVSEVFRTSRISDSAHERWTEEAIHLAHYGEPAVPEYRGQRCASTPVAIRRLQSIHQGR